jgi:hypothetical protein
MTHEKVREIDIERFGEKIHLSVFRFSRDEVPLTKVKGVRKRTYNRVLNSVVQRNTEHYAKWIISLMEEHTSKELRHQIGKMRKYNVLALFMNDKNNEWILNYIHPMDFLNWGPVVLNALEDDEYALDLGNLTTENRDG